MKTYIWICEHKTINCKVYKEEVKISVYLIFSYSEEPEV